MNFKDFYSKQAAEYSKYRPAYPEELFQYLNSIVSNHDLALDCATGSGQAARGLAKYFKKVIAIDASKTQIKNAYQLPNIEYKVLKAEDTGLGSKSLDLVTIATAIHWLDTKLFYNEVKRVLKDDGMIAVWTYSTTCEINPELDKLINTFSNSVLHRHWDEGIKKVWSFDEIEFPFKQIEAPDFEIRKKLTCDEFLNYMYTWSSVHQYIEVHNSNPIDLFKDDLRKVWGKNFKREIVWKIKMKVGRKLTLHSF